MLLNDILFGFKAGLSSNAAQKMLHLSKPVYGVLFKSGELMSPSIISLDNYRNLLIELELGYIMNIDIEESLENTTQLAGLVKFICPVVELPDIGFKDIKHIKSVDIISTNVGSNKYILGNKYKFDKSIISDINIKMYHDGKLISTVVTRDAGENQLSYLLWMINNITEAGYKIRAGKILITGSIGNSNKADKGVYMTDFSDFEKIYFEVR